MFMLKVLIVLSVANLVASLLVFKRARELDHLAISVAGLGNALNETLEALQGLFDAAQGVISERISTLDRNQLSIDLAPRPTVESRSHRRSSMTRTPHAAPAAATGDDDATGALS
jgi:hypothetical protein